MDINSFGTEHTTPGSSVRADLPLEGQLEQSKKRLDEARNTFYNTTGTPQKEAIADGMRESGYGQETVTTPPQKEAHEIVASLWDKLPAMASDLVREALDLTLEKNKNYANNPDDYREHEPNWHQWGVVTHTKMFERAYHEEIPKYLEEWGLSDAVTTYLRESIDGKQKAELLNIAIPLHDLGKFTMRTLETKDDGQISQSFKKHEADSGRIIREPEFVTMMKTEYGLTDAQIEYIARCAELHYELGVVRNEAKKTDLGYTVNFATSDRFRTTAVEIMSKYPDFALEVGLEFLADNLAKTDVRIPASTDDEVEQFAGQGKDEIEKRNLNPKLINAVKQMPANIAIAHEYLKIWKERT